MRVGGMGNGTPLPVVVRWEKTTGKQVRLPMPPNSILPLFDFHSDDRQVVFGLQAAGLCIELVGEIDQQVFRGEMLAAVEFVLPALAVAQVVAAEGDFDAVAVNEE